MFTPRTSKSDPDSHTPHLPPGKFVFSRGRLIGVGVLGGLVGAAAVGLALSAISSSVTRPTFPSAANTGVPATMTLKAVPSQLSSGPGWSYNAGLNLVEVSGSNVVLSGLSIPCNLDITGSHVTINDDKVITGGDFGITLKHTADVTIENSTISGLNTTTGRVGSAIDDSYGDSTGMVVQDNNISDFKSAVQLTTGLVTGNYIHDPGTSPETTPMG